MANETARLVLTFIHLVSVAFLLGGLGTQAIWKVSADRSRDARVIAAIHDKLVTVDRAVTGPAAFLTFATGYAVIRVLGYFGGSIGGAAWALWGLILMFLALAFWYFGLRPLELKMADAADAAASGGAQLGPEHARRSATWLVLWAVVVGLIVVVAGLMVFKPGQ